VHELDDAVVARRRHAQLAPARRDPAVDDVDLGRPARVEVLQHRGPHVRRVAHHARERGVVEVGGLDVVDRLE
jgi:hypothetical protein